MTRSKSKSKLMLSCLLMAVALVVGCSDDTEVGSDASELSCDERQSAYLEELSSLAKSCAVDADCKMETGLAMCAACSADGVDAVSTAADLTALREHEAYFADSSQSCDNPTWCNNYACEPNFLGWTQTYRAVCAAGTCQAFADPACEDFPEGTTIQDVEADTHRSIAALEPDAPSPFACTEDADCELRDDVSSCGCDVAVAVGADTALPAYAPALVEKAGSCGVSCAECPTVSGASCVDGVCQATP